MGSILRKDRIGNLSEAGGTLSLAPSTLTIGGRQYQTSTLNVALPGMTANTRYQVYAVNNAGTLELQVSQNENSQGPAGFNGWKLVGSLYADYLGVFGSFCTITGVPTTDVFNTGPFQIGATTTPPAYGTATIVTNETWTKRVGDSAELRWALRKTVTGTGNAGSGMYLFPTPENILINTTKAKPETTVGGTNVSNSRDSNVGNWSILATTGVHYHGAVFVYDTSNVALEGSNTVTNNASHGGVNSGYGQFTVAAEVSYGINATAPISSWNNTPIEEL